MDDAAAYWSQRIVTILAAPAPEPWWMDNMELLRFVTLLAAVIASIINLVRCLW